MVLDLRDETDTPAPAASVSEDVVVYWSPELPSAESFRLLSTRMLSREAKYGLGAIAICGIDEFAQTPIVCANLAVALAGPDRRVLLIDGDVNNPSLHELIDDGTDHTPGFANLMAGEDVLLDALREDVLPGVSVLYAGKLSEHDRSFSKLLMTTTSDSIFKEIIAGYDLTIINTPPAATSAAGRRIAALAKSCIVVTRQDRTRVSELESMLKELDTANSTVVGITLNSGM